MRRLGGVAAAALVGIGIAPLALRWMARGVARLAGCPLGADAPPCPFLGADLGPALHQMDILGPLILMTLPFVFCGIVLALMLAGPARNGAE